MLAGPVYLMSGFRYAWIWVRDILKIIYLA